MAHGQSPVQVLTLQTACRYQRGSEMCQKLAQSLHHLTTVDERELFDFGSRTVAETAPLVLLLDRKEDPVTPLLMQWTYQAMVHELIGLDNNIANLRQVPGVRSRLMYTIWLCRCHVHICIVRCLCHTCSDAAVPRRIFGIPSSLLAHP